MNSIYVTAKKDTKLRRKSLSIQIFDDDICKIEGKSLLEQTDSHKRNLSKDSNNLALNSGSLVLSETVSNNSVQTFRISKSSLTTSTVKKGEDFSLNSSREKDISIKASNCELSLQSIKVEEESEGNKNLYKITLINRSSSSDSINKSYISNFSVIAVNRNKHSEIANKSLICTPNTICNYYLHSNDITPNKLCFNAASNLSNATDALNSVSATSSNQDLKAKISKINFINSNANNFNSTNSYAFEEIISDNFENNSNFNHGPRNYFDKRTPIKYNKSQFRSGEKDTCNNIKEDSSKRSSSNKDSSLNEMLKINSKLINERLSLIAREFKKNLNISELEIERDEEKNTDSKNMSYSNNTDLEYNRVVKDKEMTYEENFKIFSDAKNLNFAFEQIKDLEETNSDGNDHRRMVDSNYNAVNNLGNNHELTINILKNENFSFDITHNKAAINVINEQIDAQKAIQKNVDVINENENENEPDIKSEFISERKINAYNEQDCTKINISNSIKRIENYSFGSVNNANLNNLTALCSNLQQNRANLIDKLSNNLRKFNLHPDLRSLFRKNKSHKQFENTMMETNREKLEDRKDDSIKENLDIDNENKKVIISQQEIIEISGDKLYQQKDKNTPVVKDDNIIAFNSSKNNKTYKLSPGYITNEKGTEATLPSTGKSNHASKQNQSSKIESCSKELSEFEIKKSVMLTKLKKEEIPNRIGLNIKEIVIRAKDKENKTTSTSYFSPGERKKNSISPRYNLKKTQSKPTLTNDTLICPGRNLKFLDMIKLYSTKGQGAFINKGTSPINTKFNSYTKSYSKSRLNGASFVSNNNNSYARSTSRNNSKNRTIEATYRADQTSGNLSCIKIKNSVKKNDTKDFKFTEAMDAEESIRKRVIDSECKSLNNQSNISQYKKHVIPVYTKDKAVGIIKSMKDMSKHSDVNYKCVTERIKTNSNLSANTKINVNTNQEIKTNSYSNSYSNSKLNNKIKLNHQINNVQIPSILIYEKENKKDFINFTQDQIRNNIVNNSIIQNNKTSAANISNGALNKKENLYITKGIISDSSITGKENDKGNQSNFVNAPTQNKKNIQVISNFSNYTKKKTPDVIKPLLVAKQSNEISTLLINKQNAIPNLNKINYMNDKKVPSQSGRITMCNNRSRLMKEKINNIINKQIVSSKIKYLSGDDDFVFFDE